MTEVVYCGGGCNDSYNCVGCVASRWKEKLPGSKDFIVSCLKSHNTPLERMRKAAEKVSISRVGRYRHNKVDRVSETRDPRGISCPRINITWPASIFQDELQPRSSPITLNTHELLCYFIFFVQINI
jgi:hypothetical protein